jgi:hypothetical protein
VLSTYTDHLQTYDLRLPVWIVHCAAWLGLAAAVALLALRTVRMLAGRAVALRQPQAAPAEPDA